MSTSVDAVYEDGVFKPEQPVALKERTKVHLIIEDLASAPDAEDSTDWKAAESFVGFIKNAPEGEPIARDHDKHIYK